MTKQFEQLFGYITDEQKRIVKTNEDLLRARGNERVERRNRQWSEFQSFQPKEKKLELWYQSSNFWPDEKLKDEQKLILLKLWKPLLTSLNKEQVEHFKKQLSIFRSAM